MTTKQEITKALKKAGVVNVSMSTRNWVDPPKPIKTHDNKFIKGVKAGSIGPITMTDAYRQHNQQTIDKVYQALNSLNPSTIAFTSSRLTATFKINQKLTRTVSFNLLLFPTNSPKVDLDPGYKTYWYVQEIKDSKI
jgi:hypothetical protein